MSFWWYCCHCGWRTPIYRDRGWCEADQEYHLLKKHPEQIKNRTWPAAEYAISFW